MNLKPIAANMTEIETSSFRILFSYSTPVALKNKETGLYCKTSKFWSRTTNRHISKWLNGNEATELDQSKFDVLTEVK